MDERAFWLLMRQALLLMVDAIEQRLQMARTSEIRKLLREQEKSSIVMATE